MARSGRLHRTGHLVRRFCGSLRPGGPSSVDEVWVAGLLGDAELDLWLQMSGADRRHAVGVARRVAGLLDTSEGMAPDAPVMAAALLHDVGKVRSGLGTFGRVAATGLAAVAPGRVNRWPDRGGVKGRIGLYLLSAAGSAPLTVAWTLEHHRPADRWSMDRRLADVLHAADDD